MQDKSNNGSDDEEFSLNKFDLKDDEQKQESGETDGFNALIGGNELLDSGYDNDKQAPSVPEVFESEEETIAADEVVAFAAADYPSPVAEKPLIAADMDRLDDVFTEEAEQQPVQEQSGSRVMTMFVVVAVVIVALVAWLNIGGDDDDAVSERHLSQPVLGEDVQMQRSEKKLLEMQESLTSLQQRLTAKDEQIAELTHLVAEQSRKRQKLEAKKVAPVFKKVAPVIHKVRPVVKKTVVKSAFEPIQSAHPTVKKQTSGWVIVIASVATRAAADNALKGLKANGINAEVKPTTVKGRPWYRIRISGLKSRQEANTKKAYLLKQHGIKDTWIHKPG
ncbi:MAG: SPOR domain-containing protein [Mariprofundaceae bacterium]